MVGLEGLRPSKNHHFLVVVAGFAGNDHQKMEFSERRCHPEHLYRISPFSQRENITNQHTIAALQAACYNACVPHSGALCARWGWRNDGVL